MITSATWRGEQREEGPAEMADDVFFSYLVCRVLSATVSATLSYCLVLFGQRVVPSRVPSRVQQSTDYEAKHLGRDTGQDLPWFTSHPSGPLNA